MKVRGRESALLRQIARKNVDLEKVADRVARNPERIQGAIDGLNSDRADVKHRCAKALRIASQRRPEALYPFIDSFIHLLDVENRIMNWEGTIVIGNLATADTEGRIDRILNRYLAPISGPAMISAANSIAGAARIARAKPHLAGRIVVEILKVEHAEYKTTECRNVAIGHAINSFDLFFEQVEDKEPVIAFVRRQLANTRNSTRKKAERFLRKQGCV
jgi:hypothetical protein